MWRVGVRLTGAHRLRVANMLTCHLHMSGRCVHLKKNAWECSKHHIQLSFRRLGSVAVKERRFLYRFSTLMITFTGAIFVCTEGLRFTRRSCPAGWSVQWSASGATCMKWHLSVRYRRSPACFQIGLRGFIGCCGPGCHSNRLQSCGGCENLLSARSALVISCTHTHTHTVKLTPLCFKLYIKALGGANKHAWTRACWCKHTLIRSRTSGPPFSCSCSVLYWLFLSEQQ